MDFCELQDGDELWIILNYVMMMSCGFTRYEGRSEIVLVLHVFQRLCYDKYNAKGTCMHTIFTDYINGREMRIIKIFYLKIACVGHMHAILLLQDRHVRTDIFRLRVFENFQCSGKVTCGFTRLNGKIR